MGYLSTFKTKQKKIIFYTALVIYILFYLGYDEWEVTLLNVIRTRIIWSVVKYLLLISVKMKTSKFVSGKQFAYFPRVNKRVGELYEMVICLSAFICIYIYVYYDAYYIYINIIYIHRYGVHNLSNL